VLAASCAKDAMNLSEWPREQTAFAGGGFGPLVFESVVEAPTRTKAKKALADLTKAFGGCASGAEQTPANDFITVLPVALPTYGNESKAFRISARMEDLSLNGHIVMLRKGRNVAVLSHVSLVNKPSLKLTKKLSAKAVSRLN